MAGWTRVSEHRWQQFQDDLGQDGSRNFLLRSGGLLLELHVSDDNATLHRYAGAIGDEATPMLNQDGNAFTGSEEIPNLIDVDPATAWAALERVAQDG